MIVGIAGACRRVELMQLQVDDIDDRKSVIVIKIPTTKNNIARTFTIIDRPDEDISYLTIFRKYYNLRPINASFRRFFCAYRNGKCINQVVGLCTIGKIPSRIATYLCLKNPNTYTGHAFRRSSVTLLADTGVDTLGLKRHGGWRSSSVAEGYVADSLQNKIQFANNILYDVTNSDLRSSTNNINTDASGSLSNLDLQNSLNNINTKASKSQDEIPSVIINNCENCKITITINGNRLDSIAE